MAGKTCLILLISLPAVLLKPAENVFVTHSEANGILSRWKRANSVFEEFKKGDLERECYEERCSHEEAREVFENEEKTTEFWSKYVDGDQCSSSPCLYGGSCKDGVNEFTCLCKSGFEGKMCEIVVLKMCSLNNGGCDQYCKVQDRDVVCSCTTGYKLGDDGKSCVPIDKYPCGRRPGYRGKRSIPEEEESHANHTDILQISNVTANQTDSTTLGENSQSEDDVTEPPFYDFNPDSRIVGGKDCRFGECPWQAVLFSEDDEPFCGGTILSRHFVLTAAHCMNQTKYFKVIVGEMNTLKKDGTESVHKVDKIIIHPKFVRLTYDFDIAVIKLKEAINFTDNIIPACLPDPDFADQVLMTENQAMVSGFGRLHERGAQATKLQMLYVPYVSRQTCKESSKFTISENMFCAGYDKEVKDACQGDSGGPHVTPYKDTFFITGIVSWGEGCAQQGKYGVYTKVSKLHKWLKGVLKRHLKKGVSSIYQLLKQHCFPFYRGSKMANFMQTLCISFLILLIQQTEQTVFLSSKSANQVIQRSKRANFMIIEELRRGNLERECLEEICTYEEARETFEDTDKTDTFWKTYYGGNPCSSSPCKNNGVCIDYIRRYTCTCPEGYKGRNCQFAANECHPEAEDGCQHFCEPKYGLDFYICSCASGYTLGEDDKSCHPADPFACGQLLNDKDTTFQGIQNNSTNPFPWEVLLLDSEGTPYCSGVILNQSLVLTTAKCSSHQGPIFILAGNKDANNMQKIKVESHRIHTKYSKDSGENNIALLNLEAGIKFHKHILPICIPQKDFAENVLIPRGPGTVSGWTLDSDDLGMMPIQFPVIQTDKEACETAFNATQTNRMFCGTSNRTIDSALASGSHFAIEHNGAWFLTGIMGSVNHELWNPNVFSFTKISRYVMWLKQNSS
ncbi:coagulation factor X-like [Dendropsophus ebraccatus]|uniref:coagulation factor X-like n=1 Tax=Dendropsophus ebraccatus TaxID=150705 RepID=UPI0038319D4A